MGPSGCSGTRPDPGPLPATAAAASAAGAGGAGPPSAHAADGQLHGTWGFSHAAAWPATAEDEPVFPRSREPQSGKPFHRHLRTRPPVAHAPAEPQHGTFPAPPSAAVSPPPPYCSPRRIRCPQSQILPKSSSTRGCQATNP